MIVEQEDDGGGTEPPAGGDVDYDRIEQIVVDVLERVEIRTGNE